MEPTAEHCYHYSNTGIHVNYITGSPSWPSSNSICTEQLWQDAKKHSTHKITAPCQERYSPDFQSLYLTIYTLDGISPRAPLFRG